MTYDRLLHDIYVRHSLKTLLDINNAVKSPCHEYYLLVFNFKSDQTINIYSAISNKLMFTNNKVLLIIAVIYAQTVFAVGLIENVETAEVDYGKSVVLHCKSNDELHNFKFWHLSTTGIVIGPTNSFNTNKFKYEILSGNLTIKGVTANEAGIYTCVSDGVDKRDIHVHSINLVLKNWETKKENTVAHPVIQTDNNGSLWKVSAILGTILVFLVVILVALHVYHKERERPNYFEQNDEDEDSTEELFTREASTSGAKSPPKVGNGKSDNFKKVFTTINMSSST